ncbi:hypothetical protein [Bdellovibrio bacteriovorus]|uniref:hypothetical protein n=1 Tax=Bdellovibrio bacteriovorus TaxID=959 RepID=UPI0035A8831E
MKGLLKYGTLLTSVAVLVGCVEFKNDGEEEAPQNPQPMVDVQPMGNLVVDRTLYVFEGKIVSEEDLEFLKFKKEKEVETESKSKTEDFEFQFDDLRFEDGGVLYTMGANVRIHAKTLSSANGKIATFPEEKKAETGKNGRDGGHIFLNVGLATGALRIEMRGEAGGDGHSANEPDDRLKGPPGVDRKKGGCERGGIVLLPGEGEQGGQGLKGYPGHDGKRGGSTGTLELIVDDSAGFSHLIEKTPGQGGIGSRGGRGGAGGDGGLSNCRVGKRGPQGPDGNWGDGGNNGAPGEKQTSCVTKNKAMTCYN